MKKKDYLEPERLTELQHQIWNIATNHGWHEQPKSPEHWCGLIMTEIAEAVEADRYNRRANTKRMSEIIEFQAKSDEGLSYDWYEKWYHLYYKEYVKGSIEEEFADVVIRILDMAQEIHGENMIWAGYDSYGEAFNEKSSFIENAWFFIREVLNWGTMNISDSISFIFAWAQHLGIDLWQHIEWKMKYNEMRPYKHGGKKY